MPRGAPNHSPMIAPISAAGQASRRPETSDGSAAGSSSRAKRFTRSAPSTANRSR